MPPQKQHYLALDGLRGSSALIIIFYHLGFFRAGWLGVPLFFVLSGFLITNVLLAEKENENFFSSWKRFVIRRSLRIFPLYFGFLILLGIGFLITGFPEEMERAWTMLFTFSYNLFRAETDFPKSDYFSHFWSLCVEEQFYFFWPFVILLLNRKTIFYILIFLIFLAPFSRWLMAEWLREIKADIDLDQIAESVRVMTLSNLDTLAVGSLIAILLKNIKKIKSEIILFSGMGLFFCCGLGLQFHCEREFNWKFLTSFGFDDSNLCGYQHVYTLSLVSFMFGGLILTIISEKFKLLNRIFENGFLVYSGKISFGLYVFHFPLMRLFIDYGNPAFNSLYTAFAVIPLTYLVSSASYHLYEKRFLDLKEKFLIAGKN